MTSLRAALYRYGWDTRCRNRCPARLLETLLPASVRGAGASLLDVGSGDAGLAAFLRGFSVVGSDMAPARNGHHRFVQSTATALPFRDQAFPAVSCIDVLEHLAPASRPAAVAECVRVAGRLALFAFPNGTQARRHDENFRAACQARHRPLPGWVSEHLRYAYPEAGQVAEHIRVAAQAMGRRISLRQAACEPLAVSRMVRAAASRSAALYLLCNLACGLCAPILARAGGRARYRAILAAELSG